MKDAQKTQQQLVRELTASRLRIAELEKELSGHAASEEKARESEARYRYLFEHATEGIFQTSPEGRCLSANPALVRMLGYASAEEMIAEVADIGGQVYVHAENRERLKQLLREKGRVEGFEVQVYRGDGQLIWLSINARLVRDAADAEVRYEGTVEEITRRKEMEAMLRRKERELEAKSLEVEEINTALRVLLKRHEEDQQESAAGVLANLKELVFPYLDKLREGALSELQKTYLSLVQSHLEEIGNPFLRRLSLEVGTLSRSERRIAGLIKDGKRNKEISEILGVSVNTILTHRYHLRTKLGLKKKKINLISYLKSISSL